MSALALHRSPGRTARTFTAAAATLVLLACGAGGAGGGVSGPPDPPSDPIFGTWFLESVSGEQLPARINQYHDDQLDVTVKAELVNGHVTFLQNETFEFAFVIRATVGSIVGPDIPTPAEGAIPGGAWVRDGNVLHRVRGPGLPADSLVLIGNGKLQWVMTFPQGPPGSPVEADQTLIFRQSPPPE